MAQDLKGLAEQKGMTVKGLFLEMYGAYRKLGAPKVLNLGPAFPGARRREAASTARPNAPRQIIGLSLDPSMAQDLKSHAKQNGLTFKKLFLQMYEAYKKQKPRKAR